MTATASVDRRARAARVLVPLFFVSGATSLVYETLWARQLHWVFGTSQLAITTVLAGFMGGLAAGGFVGARIGVELVLMIDRAVLRPVIIGMLIGASVLLLVRKPARKRTSKATNRYRAPLR